MRIKPSLTAGLLAGTFTFNAQATLISYNANGVDLVYSSISDVTWTKDANLLHTLIAASDFDTVVANIIAANPTVTNPPNIYDGNDGVYNISTADFSSNGSTNWFGAQAFVGYLNSIAYAGSDQWRLPNASSNPVNGYNQTTGELGQLFYSELSGTAGSRIPNTAYFDNEYAGAYWLGTEYEYAPMPYYAWSFVAADPVNDVGGFQGLTFKNRYMGSWAISPGQVAELAPTANTVPEPGMLWLLCAGLAGLTGMKRHQVGSERAGVAWM
jgi:hypothetical protein